MTVAFTGYRPEKMPFIESKSDENYMRFRKRQLQVIERLIERGCTDFISGVAMGFDIWAAEDVLSLQKKNKALTLECAIPFNGQADGWDKDYQKRRYKLLSHATSSVVLSDHFSDDCYFKRNRYMVDKADVVVCAFNGKRGGTQYTVQRRGCQRIVFYIARTIHHNVVRKFAELFKECFCFGSAVLGIGVFVFAFLVSEKAEVLPFLDGDKVLNDHFVFDIRLGKRNADRTQVLAFFVRENDGQDRGFQVGVQDDDRRIEGVVDRRGKRRCKSGLSAVR